MADLLAGIRWTRAAAIVAAALTCAQISANARQQTSSSGTATEKSSATSPTQKKTSSAAKKTGSTTQHTTAGSSQKSASLSAKTSAHHSTRRTSRKSKTARVRGQQKIDAHRATSIQQALIREHYLTGEPSGLWDAESEAAMRRYQSDHGWQTKEVPDSRALIKLGLGPNNDHLLNPESAMTSTPIVPQSDPAAPASHTPALTQPAANGGKSQTSAKPATVPQTTPAAEPAPATSPKDSNDSANPQ
jgi:hypothetical protein